MVPAATRLRAIYWTILFCNSILDAMMCRYSLTKVAVHSCSGNYKKGIADGETCIKLDKTWQEGYKCIGDALMHMDR